MSIAQMTAPVRLVPTPPAAPATVPAQSRPRDVRLHTRGLVGSLNAEWTALVHDPAAAASLRRWAELHPGLAGQRDLAAVVDAARERGRDDVLVALLALARDGDALAARAALQAMLGAAVRLARRTVAHAAGDHEESLARAVAALWQVVREYPFERRSCRPVDGISLDVLALLTGSGRLRVVEVPAGLPAELTPDSAQAAAEDDDAGLRGDFWASAHPGAAGACSDEQLVLLLAWGVRRSVVTLDEANLLLRLHSPRVPGAAVTCRDLAEELGVGHATLRQRASRATRRLAAAVADLAAGESPRRLAA